MWILLGLIPIATTSSQALSRYREGWRHIACCHSKVRLHFLQTMIMPISPSNSLGSVYIAEKPIVIRRHGPFIIAQEYNYIVKDRRISAAVQYARMIDGCHGLGPWLLMRSLRPPNASAGNHLSLEAAAR